MSVTIDSLLHQAMALSDSERAVLAEKLMDTVSEEEILQSWADEAEKRLEELNGGEAESLSLDEAMAYIQERRQRGLQDRSQGTGGA